MKKNDIFATEITAFTSEGLGICRINDTVVFVPETAIGDKLNVRITKVTSSYAYGRKESLISPAKCRVTSDCKAFPKCGGCDFRHITYEEELKFKLQRVEDCVRRIAGIDLAPECIIGAKKINNYRNKAQFPVQNVNGTPELGFYRERSHDIIPTQSCLIQHADCPDVVNIFKQWMNKYSIQPYDEISHNGIIRHLYTRTSTSTGDFLICIVSYTDKIPYIKELTKMLLNTNIKISGIIQCINRSHGNKILSDDYRLLWGKDYIYDCIGELKFKISAQSFFQVNTEQAFKLYSKAKEYAQLTGNEDIIDLYCGTGTIGLFMCDKARSLYGMEIIPQAIHDAKINAEINGISNAIFETGDAGKLSLESKKFDPCNTVVFVDPPRKGLDKALIDSIAEFSPKKLVYISCDPATMARDVKIFAEKGITVQKYCAVDMFPRTRHVETVCLLSKPQNLTNTEKKATSPEIGV